MAEQIKDGTGTGRLARVDADNNLWTRSIGESIQHRISKIDELAFQVEGIANLAVGTVYALVVTNTSSDKILTVTYIRPQFVGIAGGSALPSTANLFEIGFGVSRSAGGTAATPVNVHAGSGIEAEAEAWEGAPTVTGIFTPIDTWYPKEDGDRNTYRKEGAVIVDPGRSISFRFTGDQTSGILYTRLSFTMEAISE
jgi:hypothetical protein